MNRPGSLLHVLLVSLEEKNEKNDIKGAVTADLLVRMKKEFRNFYLASESLMGRLGRVNVGAPERRTMCIRR